MNGNNGYRKGIAAQENNTSIEKEQQALREIQAKITDYFKVRAKFDEEFETAFEVPKRSLFGHAQPRVVVRRRK